LSKRSPGGRGRPLCSLKRNARACQHSGSVAFDAIGLPDETLFRDTGRARRFRCSGCRARDFAIMPDWRVIARRGWGRF